MNSMINLKSTSYAWSIVESIFEKTQKFSDKFIERLEMMSNDYLNKYDSQESTQKIKFYLDNNGLYKRSTLTKKYYSNYFRKFK